MNQLAMWEQKLFGHERNSEQAGSTSNGQSTADHDKAPNDGRLFLAERVRETWPEVAAGKTNEEIWRALENGHYNHVEVLYCLKHNVTSPIVH